MTRDERTRFEHQRVLHEERPEIHPPVDASELRSYNMVIGPDELLLAVKTESGVSYFRVNPDVARNLGLNLLETVNTQGWAELEIKQNKPRGN